MRDIKNYTIHLFSDEEYPLTKNVCSEDAFALMKAIDLDKKYVMVGGEMFAIHQIKSILRNFDAERDETYGKYLTEDERKTLDIRNLKYPELLNGKVKEFIKSKSMSEPTYNEQATARIQAGGLKTNF